MDEHELWTQWAAFGSRLVWEHVRRRGGDPEVVGRALSELPNVAALAALRANAELVNLLIGRRWYVIHAAREAGVTWHEIGDALGMSGHDAYD